MRRILVLLALALAAMPAAAQPPPAVAAAGAAFADAARWQTCFTPGEDCTRVIVAAVADARSTIRLQAYVFTSEPILRAVREARARGVDVRAILDKSQARPGRDVAAALARAGIAVAIDVRPAIAHNKVIVIDAHTVITGSFNFTRSAQARNAENVLIVRGDAALAGAYADYWRQREQHSVPYREPAAE